MIIEQVIPTKHVAYPLKPNTMITSQTTNSPILKDNNHAYIYNMYTSHFLYQDHTTIIIINLESNSFQV